MERRGPKLPRELLDQVDSGTKNHSARRARNHEPFQRSHKPANRKDQRKLERTQEKQGRARHAGRRPPNGQRRNVPVESEEEDVSEESANEAPPPPPSRKTVVKGPEIATKQPKPILKQAKATVTQALPTTTQTGPSKEAKLSRRERERLEADDDEITALEKKLGIKSSKTPKASKEDGLEDILGGLDGSDGTDGSDGHPRKRKRREDEEWLKSKRRRPAETARSAPMEDSDEDVTSGSDVEDEKDGEEELVEDAESADDRGSFDGFESEASEEPARPVRTRVKENPYVAPTIGTEASAAKYVPPSRRNAPSNDAELEQKLKRQIQGLINRLSEANILSILADFNKLYDDNPRQYVTSNTIDLLLGLICDETALNDTFIVLHAGFITALSRIIGQDFAAQIIERSIDRFDHYYPPASAESDSKELTNLLSLISQLYNFDLISCDLVFDLIRLFLTTEEDSRETHTELLLRIVRSSGPQLRQDDPSALKDIVLLLNRTIAATPTESLSVRTKFMIDTITDLKNNKIKSNAAGSSSITTEQLSRMRKAIGTLSTRYSFRANEPLRLTLADVREREKKGKWWIVGGSWKSNAADSQQPINTKTNGTSDDTLITSVPSAGDVATGNAPDLQALARAHGMTTPVRRSIFLTLLTSSDAHDAVFRLRKLHLTRTQEREISRVILACVAKEKGFNPYYALVARKLCESDKQTVKVWTFGLMGVCGRFCGQNTNEQDSDDANAGVGEEGKTAAVAVQQAKFVSSLVAAGTLPITVLKPVDWQEVEHGNNEIGGVFLEVLFVSLFTTKGVKKEGVVEIFSGVEDADGLREDLKRFLRKRVAKTDLVRNEKEKVRVLEGVGIVLGPMCFGGSGRS